MSSLYKIKRPDGSVIFQSDILVKDEFFLSEGWYNIHQIEDVNDVNYNLVWFLDSKSNMMCYKVGEQMYSIYFGCYFNSMEEFDRAWELKAFA